MSDEIERWDDEVSAVLAGQGSPASDPAALWLASAARPAPPERLVARIDRVAGHGRHSARPGRRVAWVAAALAVAFVVQGIGNLVAGDWIAENLGEAHAPHALYEGALALFALGACAAAAVVSRSWSGVSVLVCSPLAIALGLSGVREVGTFAAGAVLHLTEGVLGLLLIIAWWRDRRDTRGST